MDESWEQAGRISRLEQELDDVRRRVSALEGARVDAPVPVQRTVAPPVAVPPRAPEPPRMATRNAYLPHRSAPPRIDAREAPAPAPAPAQRARTISVEDLIGGRLLPWAGSIAVLLGVAFFVAIAIGRGWLGESARIGLAYGGAGVLLGGRAGVCEPRRRPAAGPALV